MKRRGVLFVLWFWLTVIFAIIGLLETAAYAVTEASGHIVPRLILMGGIIGFIVLSFYYLYQELTTDPEERAGTSEEAG